MVAEAEVQQVVSSKEASSRISLIAQLVKNPLAIQETRV